MIKKQAQSQLIIVVLLLSCGFIYASEVNLMDLI